MPSRSITAKWTASTREKPWSLHSATILQAFSRFFLHHHEFHRPGKKEILELQGCLSVKVNA